MLGILAAAAEFEFDIPQERQGEGIDKTKAKEVYEGGKQRSETITANNLHASGLKPWGIAKQLDYHSATASRLLSDLTKQKIMAEAELAGAPFNPKRRVTRTNGAGEKVRVDAPGSVRKGWFTDANGTMFFQLRYGSKPLEFAKCMNVVEVQNLADVPGTIGSIIDAIPGGIRLEFATSFG